MLVLARKLNEAFDVTTALGETITVTVVEIRGSVVRLGIDAPRSFHIVRDNAVDMEQKERTA